MQPDNPLADYTFSLVPCRTRKRALGDATRDYMPDLRVQHYGFVNGTAALDHLPVASAGKSAMMTAIRSKVGRGTSGEAHREIIRSFYVK